MDAKPDVISGRFGTCNGSEIRGAAALTFLKMSDIFRQSLGAPVLASPVAKRR